MNQLLNLFSIGQFPLPYMSTQLICFRPQSSTCFFYFLTDVLLATPTMRGMHCGGNWYRIRAVKVNMLFIFSLNYTGSLYLRIVCLLLNFYF